MSRYLKEGRSIRFELTRLGRTSIELAERGEAVESDGRFEARSLLGPPDSVPMPPPIPSALFDFAERESESLERATLVTGAARHTYSEGERERSWTETSARLHVSLVDPVRGLRCEIDRGGDVLEETVAGELRMIVQSLRSSTEGRHWQTEPILLDPAVTAHLTAAFFLHSTPHVQLRQRPRNGEIDGRGRTLDPCPLSEIRSLGWYRPSYRSQPRRVPHGLELDVEGRASSEPRRRAIALLALEQSGVSFELHCLVRDRSGHTTTDWIRIDPTGLEDAAAQAFAESSWYPSLAGVWGRPVVAHPLG